jgi:hypothetical protein
MIVRLCHARRTNQIESLGQVRVPTGRHHCVCVLSNYLLYCALKSAASSSYRDFYLVYFFCSCLPIVVNWMLLVPS